MTLFGKEHVLTTPLSKSDVTQLKSGDIVCINGEIWSGRSKALRRFVEKREPLPIDTQKYNVFFTGGEGMMPADEDHSYWDPLSVGATLGLRFEKWFPDLIKYAGMRAVITKGNMGAGTQEACMEYGCVQLTPFGLTMNPHFTDVLKRNVRDDEVFWREAGLAEAIIIYHVGNTGPWLVNMDTKGNILYDRIYSGTDSKLRDIYRKIGLPKNFKFSSLEQ